jgi:hypothetical protein
MLSERLFERFAQGSPVSVMVRATFENVCSAEALDALFEAYAQKQYERELLFSSAADLLSLVVCGTRKSVHDAYQAAAEKFTVSVKAVYDKLNGVECPVSRALVRQTGPRLERLLHRLGAMAPPPLRGYRTKIVDGSHLPSTEHRLGVLRTTRRGPLPGQALVVLEPELMLITDVFPCEDGHAQERSLLPELLETVQQRDLWIADRNFCTTGFLFGIARRKACFLIRQHASTLTWELVGKRHKAGRCDRGMVYEQAVRLTNRDGEELLIRRVTIVLDEPTRDGECEIHLLTNLPDEHAKPLKVAELYRRRWTVENAFQEVERSLPSELNTLGYPPAALLALCLALLTYNVLSIVKSALRAVHGKSAEPHTLSGYHMAAEIAAVYGGMMLALPPEEWTRRFAELNVASMARTLKELAACVRIAQFRKHPRGPKKTKPKRTSGLIHHHVSTARLLAAHKTATK